MKHVLYIIYIIAVMYSTLMLISNTQKGNKKTGTYLFIIFMHFGLYGSEGGGGGGGVGWGG